MANPNGAFRINGVPMQGAVMTTGSIFFVDSVTGSSGNSGETIGSPLATADQATNKCTANKGDVVYFLPNHAETLGDNKTSWVPDIAGVTYVGLGNGTDRPEFTFSGTSSEIEIGAANITFKNLRFKGGVSAIDLGIDVNADYFTMEDCEMFYGDTSGYDWIDMIDVSAVDWCKIKNNRFIAQDAAGCNTAVHFVDANYIEITGNYFSGTFAEAPIWNITTAGVGILIADNIIYNSDTANADNGISLQAACTGIITRNMIGTLYATQINTIIDPGSCLCSENYISNAIDEYAIATSLVTASS
jgi:hypothetical protein